MKSRKVGRGSIEHLLCARPAVPLVSGPFILLESIENIKVLLFMLVISVEIHHIGNIKNIKYQLIQNISNKIITF